MPKSTPRLKASNPKSVLTKPLQFDFKELLKALGKAVGHTAALKWEELAADAAEAVAAIGLVTEPGELAFLLIRRSLTRAAFELVGESASPQLAESKIDADQVLRTLEPSIITKVFTISSDFLDRPGDLELITDVQSVLAAWLAGLGLKTETATAIVRRLPTYFAYALNQEWRKNAKSYQPLLEALDTPFSKAGEREWAWTTYCAYLQRRISEGIFGEPFSLSQIYVPLNAYYEEKGRNTSDDSLKRPGRGRSRVVVELHNELSKWVSKSAAADAIRVISGGPGSGKSSFARIFAAHLAAEGEVRVLFVPLHLIDASKDLVDEVGRFIRDEGILLQNPLDPDSREPNLLIIFDGLDELASQGKAAAETARAFVREVERTVERRNQRAVHLRILLSGREVVVQDNESEFRRPQQVLTLLPYFAPAVRDMDPRHGSIPDEFNDPLKLLQIDLRQQWWKTYGILSGKPFNGLPDELSREDLAEVTAQPLLNYLVALSFTRNQLDFSKDINLNSIYEDLLIAVHERGYEKQRAYGPIRHMRVTDFARVLEEIGLAAWHGDGRTTTVSEIENHCRTSGLGNLLDVFQDGAKAGVTRLLAAFFFRQYGQRPTGDPTFVFTHKSFGEYLTARRIVRALDRIARELDTRNQTPDGGWDEREALKHWVQVCGPSAITRYLFVFLLNEVKLRDPKEIAIWQTMLTGLFSYLLRHGMPMEMLPISPFKEAAFQSRNAEEALLVVLNACAQVTRVVSPIKQLDPTAFGAWFKRVQGQRTSADSVLAARCLSYLDLNDSVLDIGDFYNSDFSFSLLRNVQAHFACFSRSIFVGADLSGGVFAESMFAHSDLLEAKLNKAILFGTDFRGARLRRADLREAKLEYADLTGADFQKSDLTGAVLTKAKLHRSTGKRNRAAAMEEPRRRLPVPP